MFSQGGLSLDQAPPISVVLRFFITASIFGILAGLLLLVFGKEVSVSSSPKAVILTHTLALGVMASFMLGALFQMLPVIAGVVLQTPTKKAMFVHVAFTLGVISVLIAFYTSSSYLYLISAFLLASSLLFATYIMTNNLLKLQDHSSSSKGMLFALIGFTIAITLGLYLLLTLGGFIEGVYFSKIKELHYSFGLFGWVTLLIISISFQVIEMFYVTPSYPKEIGKYLVLMIFALLLFSPLQSTISSILISLLFITYAILTIQRLSKRKRPTKDATVWFWRFGMGMLIAAMSISIAGQFIENETLKSLSYITFIFFALSIVFAMVYKIVPFLVWFHLSNQGFMDAPLMFDIVHPKEIKKHFYLHIGTFTLWILALFSDYLFVVASLMVIASFGLLLYHLIFAANKYKYTQKNSKPMKW
jgi:MFS family permease